MRFPIRSDVPPASLEAIWTTEKIQFIDLSNALCRFDSTYP